MGESTQCVAVKMPFAGFVMIVPLTALPSFQIERMIMLKLATHCLAHRAQHVKI